MSQLELRRGDTVDTPPKMARTPAPSGDIAPTWYQEEHRRLDANIARLAIVTERVADLTTMTYYDDCLAGLRAVGGAMRRVNLIVVHEHLEPSVATGSPLASYLLWAYLWCGDVVGALESLAMTAGVVSWEGDRRRMVDSDTVYLSTYLDPLLGDLDRQWAHSTMADSARHSRAAVELLQDAIRTLSGTLARPCLPPHGAAGGAGDRGP